MAPYVTSFGYNGATGMVQSVSAVTSAGTSTWTLAPAMAAALATNPAIDAGQANTAVLTDPLGDPTVYVLDGRGREIEEIAPDGAIQTWVRNSNGLVTLYTDALGRKTQYLYGGDGDVTEVFNPDGSWTQYDYNAFQEVTETIQEDSACANDGDPGQLQLDGRPGQRNHRGVDGGRGHDLLLLDGWLADGNDGPGREHHEQLVRRRPAVDGNGCQ